MKIAFLNLCHCDPEVVARVSNKLTKHPDFDMYIHVDAKQDITPFQALLKENSQTFFVENRKKVYWGGFHAIEATIELLREAYHSETEYDYFVLLQNLDYPIKSNAYIEAFFNAHMGTEFMRACNIANTKDWHYARKYKIYNKRDDDFYLKKKSQLKKKLRHGWLALHSITTIGFSGVIKEKGKKYPIYYGAAQWAITRECAGYLLNFYEKHPKFNKIMKHIQFPDEEYFQTIVHNSRFKTRCSAYNEKTRRWLVNWRNLHYFEYPKEIQVFDEKDFMKLMRQKELFIRKVRSSESEQLMDLVDKATERKGLNNPKSRKERSYIIRA